MTPQRRLRLTARSRAVLSMNRGGDVRHRTDAGAGIPDTVLSRDCMTVAVHCRSEIQLIKTRALQNAILNSANFSIIATDPHGVIQLFNVGAERMLGYAAENVVNKVNPSDLHDPTEVLERARALSAEFGVAIAPGFEALAFKASRGIEDIYELTYVCADGNRFPAIVSITALLDDYGEIIGYLLIGSHNSVRKLVERDAIPYRNDDRGLDLKLPLVEIDGRELRPSPLAPAIVRYSLTRRSEVSFVEGTGRPQAWLRTLKEMGRQPWLWRRQ